MYGALDENPPSYQSALRSDATSSDHSSGARDDLELRSGDKSVDADISLPKSVFVDVLEKRRYRATQCRSVPISVALYIFFIISLLLHVDIKNANSAETALNNGVVAAGDGFYLSSQDDWYYWMRETLLPTMLGTGDASWGYYAVMVGGIRIAQTRSDSTSCNDISAQLQRVYGDVCYDWDSISSSAYGDFNATQEMNVASAFQPTPAQIASNNGLYEFEFYFSTESDILTAQSLIDNLTMAGWLDGATRTVATQISLLNGEVGLYERVEFTAEFTRGSKVITTSSVISIDTNPYAGRGYLYVLDTVMIIYWIYLLVGTVRRILKAVRSGGSWSERLSHVFAYFRLLDTANTLSLLVVIISWSVTCNKLVGIENYIESIDDASRDTFANGPSDIQKRIFDATESFASFKVAAVVTLILLTLRLFKYFQFQPRLAVMTEVFSRGLSDAVHFGFLFGLLLAMYGVWGHFMFGPQAPDWQDPRVSIVSVFRFVMYDYDLIAMEQQYRDMADIFYCTFMIGITNLVLWMFLAVLLENYTEVRYESHRGPSAFQEAGAYLYSLPKTMKICRRRGVFANRNMDIYTWAEILHAVQTEAQLKFADDITPSRLAAAMRVSIESATDFLLEVAASAHITAKIAAAAEFEKPLPAELFYGGVTAAKLASIAGNLATAAQNGDRNSIYPDSMLTAAERDERRARIAAANQSAASLQAMRELQDTVKMLTAEVTELRSRMTDPR